MNIPISNVARLIENRSDERDKVKLTNALRDLTNQQVNAWPDIVTTTTATLTSVWFDTLAPNSVADLMLAAVAVNADGSHAAGYRRRAVFARAGSCAVAYLGAGADIIGVDKETDAAWDAGFALDASHPDTVWAVVTGGALSLDWRVNITGVVAPWTT